MNFIKKTINDLCFSEKWINWTQCITIPYFRVVGNGRTGDFFQHERGIRHGDLLSPCVFMIYAEYLGCYIYLCQIKKNLV